MSFHQFNQPTLDGTPHDFSGAKGLVLLVVNVASKCGFTKQYEAMQALHEKLHPRGFAVLGFPCNQFGKQEPGSSDEIAEFCEKNYGVTFPMFTKVDVNGDDAHPAFAWLTSQETQPVAAGPIPWNFCKFVIGKDGQVVARFGPDVTPDDPAVLAAIESAFA